MNSDIQTESQFLGDLPPLRVRKHGKQPEKRQVSKRWLMSSVLVGVTSFALMGGALFAAFEGREQLTMPAQAYERASASPDSELAPRGNHPGLLSRLTEETSNVMMVSTVSREGEKNVVKVRPFLNIKSTMALAPRTQEKFPPFNALTIFSESGNEEIIAKSSDFMYGADVEGEVTLNILDFPFEEASKNAKPRQRSTEIMQQIRAVADNLSSGSAYVSALAHFDTQRFSQTDQFIFSTADVSITAENVSLLAKLPKEKYPGVRYDDRMIKVLANNTIAKVLELEGVGTVEAESVETVLAADLGSEKLKTGDQLQTWFRIEPTEDGSIKTIAKISVYRGSSHMVSIARTDNARFVYSAKPPEADEIIAEAEKNLVLPTEFPSVYTGIYRSAMNEGLTKDLASSLVKIFAFDVDFRSRIGPKDQLEVFVSLEEGQEKPSAESEILYAGISLGGVDRRYYRFRDAKTGRVDYYDETGKSAKKFLLRKPVPNGKFRSKFGMRRHPISRVYKLHGGVDWSAPRGAPILAAGNGIVEKAGWSGGYGKQTVIRHANGYETSYSHQTAIAKGVRPGRRVRQGQVIGYVGSTGYSTGPHLHYEVKVNNNRVDPMRIRLPKGDVLKDAELAAFEAERDRIDALVNQEDLEETEVASN
jgi:murein DD-endopeptidase MepM/ murein hydrolase activator NlpD